MQKEEFKAFTGMSASQFSDTQWDLITAAASERLAAFLCLESLPTFTDKNRDLEALFASFVAGCIKFGGSGEKVESKTIRSFSVHFGEGAASVFANIGQNFGDVIEKYSQCDTGVKVERGERYCCAGGSDVSF